MPMAKNDYGHDNPSFIRHSNSDITNGHTLNGVYVDPPLVRHSIGLQTNDIIHHELKITVEKSEEDRAQWGNGLEFLMSCIAMSVGLGNIWRFPFTCYENGGGAFIIPYVIVLLIIGRPIYYMEMALGQFSSRGNVKMFEALAPALKGIGYGQLIGSVCVATYYCSLMALTLFYLFNSFTSNLPWSECWPEWEGHILDNRTCVASKLTTNISAGVESVSSSELYFTMEVLKEARNIDSGIGLPEWRLTLCLLASWIITFLVSKQGVKSSGKASYFLALFPYVVMIALLIRACTLEGALDGIIFFINPQWDKLASANVWYAAVTQCFFSLNVGFGSITMYSSYNNFEHNINRDALVVTTLDTLTSLLAGTTIFGILGNLAFELNVEVDQVINSGGTGLAFISYPEAIAKFTNVSWLFAILFFVMLFVLGVGSLVALQGCASTVITDAFPNIKKWHVSLGTAFVGFLIGLIYVTPGGQFMLNLVDHFGGTFIIYIMAIIEIVTVMWFYGLENFCIDMEFMLKRKVSVYWRLTWGLVTPVILLIIFGYFLATLQKLKYGSLDYPDSALVCGWLILIVGLGQLIYFIFQSVYDHKDKGCGEAVSKAFSSKNWGPTNPIRYEEYKKFKQEKLLELNSQERSWFKKSLDSLFKS